MEISDRNLAIKKITEMSPEQVSKVLVFMDNMEGKKGDASLQDIQETPASTEAEVVL